MSINEININGKGQFLNQLKYPERIENINIFFSEEKYDWNDTLPDRIGVYAIIDSKNEVIYVGKATGVEGLKGRHKKHEKNALFKLFDAKEIIVYFAEDETKDDEGILVLLERIMIYGHEPSLNNDIKGSIPTQYYVSDRLAKRLDELITNYNVNGSEEDKTMLDTAYNELEILTENSKKAKESYENAVRSKLNNKIIEERKKVMNERFKSLKDYIDAILRGIVDFPLYP